MIIKRINDRSHKSVNYSNRRGKLANSLRQNYSTRITELEEENKLPTSY